MVWSLTLLPVLAGGLAWAGGVRVAPERRAGVVGGGAAGALLATLVLAVVAATRTAADTYAVGAGIELLVDLSAPANVVAIVVPAVAAVVVAWAAAHEPPDDLPRLLGLLTVFAGAMELLVTAADLLTLTVAFELVAALSWGLIGHHWRDPVTSRAGAHAFNATRFGGLGLFLAAGAALAATGTFAFDDLATLTGTNLHVVVAGVLVAAAAKSAQGPFAPWLFSAMAGPTPVSALLHSSTMVAAGAYVLARLHPVLDRADWFGPVTIALGLTTALAGSVVALLQPHAKKLLAASTSAQYGLMLVAVGAGYPAVAIVHLVVHAAFKAQLFLVAGIAIRAVGSESLGRMRLGSQLRVTAVLAAIASLALAAVPPLGGAYSKESIVAAAGHEATWLAVLTIAAGGLSAAYATRFQLLAFGRDRGSGTPLRQLASAPSAVERWAVGVLAGASVLLGLLWLPPVHDAAARVLGGELASGPPWELVASLVVVAIAGYAVWTLDRGQRLGSIGTAGASARAAEWLGLATATRRTVVDPSLRLAAVLARFDDRVVDAGVRGVAVAGTRTAALLGRRVEPGVDGIVAAIATGSRALARGSVRTGERAVDGTVAAVAWVVDRGGADARRIQTGMVHHQFVVIAVGLALVVVAAVVGR